MLPERSRSGAGAEPERSRSGAGAGAEPERSRSGAGAEPEPERSRSGAGAEPERSRSGAGAEPGCGRRVGVPSVCAYVSAIQLMMRSLVPMSGAGTSMPGPAGTTTLGTTVQLI